MNRGVPPSRQQPVASATPPAPPSQRRKKPSMYLDGQLHFQKERKCDYVLIAYEKDPYQDPTEIGPGRPPRYIATQSVPVKLSHQVFLQMSFGILKDRLVGRAQGGFLPSPDDIARGVTLEQDVLALFFFLGRFLTEMERCRADVESGQHRARIEAKQAAASRHQQATIQSRRGRSSSTSMRGGGSRGGGSVPTSSMVSRNSTRTTSPTSRLPPISSSPAHPTQPPLITKQNVRFQLLLEYGVDVQQLLQGMGSGRHFEEYWRHTMSPKGITEEEFYNQIGKPSGMAQECTMM